MYATIGDTITMGSEPFAVMTPEEVKCILGEHTPNKQIRFLNDYFLVAEFNAACKLVKQSEDIYKISLI